jgi:hypothetical protein
VFNTEALASALLREQSEWLRSHDIPYSIDAAFERDGWGQNAVATPLTTGVCVRLIAQFRFDNDTDAVLFKLRFG